MRILVTNDDGIRAEGIRYLARFASTIGEAVVVAPKAEKSACAQSITLRRPFSFEKSDCFQAEGIEAYEVDSTPADCVRIAVSLLEPFDLVFSGINNGYNTGHFTSYSGTCAAILEANYAGIPSFGFSTDVGLMKEAAEELPRIWQFVTEHRLTDYGSIYNVNIPPHFQSFRITKLQGAFCHDVFEERAPKQYQAKLFTADWEKQDKDIRYDMDAFFGGYCSITPMQTDRTDLKAYEALKGLEN